MKRKAFKILSSASDTSELNKAIDNERKRYKQIINGEKVDKPKEGLSVQRIGFGQIDESEFEK